MPKRELERKHEQKKSFEIEKYPLLKGVFTGTGVEAEYEHERRYLPSRPLSPEELEERSDHSSEIEQVYVRGKDSEGEFHSFRLRRTRMTGKEGDLLHVSYKLKIENTRARIEYQSIFPPTDPRANVFEELWRQHRWNSVEKTRYYIPHTFKLPNGEERTCKIHYDVHHGRLEGLVRIEVEFINDDDAHFVEENMDSGVLPDFIGKDVSDMVRFGGKAMAKRRPSTHVSS